MENKKSAKPKAKKPAKKPAAKKPAAKKEQPVVTQEIQAPYRFTPEEVASMNVGLRMKLNDLDTLADQKKSAMADFKLRETNIENEAKQLRVKLEQGEEMRPVKAEVQFDAESGIKRLYFPNGGAFIRQEPMQPADWQLPLFQPAGDGKEKPAERGATDVPAGLPGGKPAPAAKPKKPDNANAGSTPVGGVLDHVTVLVDAPRLTIDLTLDWQRPALMKEFAKVAKAASWKQAQIGLLRDVLDKCENIEAMKDTLRAHCEPVSKPVEDALPGAE